MIFSFIRFREHLCDAVVPIATKSATYIYDFVNSIMFIFVLLPNLNLKLIIFGETSFFFIFSENR